MLFALVATPFLSSHLCGGFLGGMASLALFGLGAVLFVGLAIVGGGTAALVALAVLLAVVCAIAAALLPIVLPVLLLVLLIALPIKLARRNARSAAV